VWTTENGRQAAELYQRHRDRIDVVLLDVRMPELDGPATLAELQRCNPDVCCCFITGDSGLYTEEELLAAGAVRVLRKPFAFDVIINTIRQLARQALQSWLERWIEISLEENAEEARLALHVAGQTSHPPCGSGKPTTSHTAESTRCSLP
jgi:DNA-binding NtrC family response regulator